MHLTRDSVDRSVSTPNWGGGGGGTVKGEGTGTGSTSLGRRPVGR